MAMKIYEVKEILKAEVLHGEDRLDESILAGGGADLMEDVLAAAAKSAVLLTGLTTEQVLRTAKIAGVGCIVFVRGKRPPENVLALARSYELPVLLTRYSLFVASGRLYMNGLRGLDGSW
jgi:predicted transcriptional regulator